MAGEESCVSADADAGLRSSFVAFNGEEGMDVQEKQEEEVEDAPEEEDGEDMDAGEEEYVEDDGEYTFRFEDGINPLDFVENNDSGVQSYQQFERLENEALADRKRKAAEDLQPDGPSFKKVREEDMSGASMEEIMEALNFGVRRKSRKPKKRGRRKGSKNKLDPQLTRMLGDATIHYAHERYEEAISILHEVIRLAPNLPDSYHTLGLVYSSLKDDKKAMNFYMIAALLTPKDSSLWKMLFTWSIEQGDVGQAGYCLSKAITADPKDITLRIHRASLYVELKDYQRAAETYLQIYQLFPEKVGALKSAAKLYQKCGQVECSIHILEDYLKGQQAEASESIVDLLASIYMETKAYDRALQHIEHAQAVHYAGKELPLNLKIKAGICHIHLGNMQMAQVLFNDLKPENATEHYDLVIDIADSLVALGHYNYALSYYLMLEAKSGSENGLLHLKIARCFLSLKERLRAIEFFYKALETLEDDIDARITLTSLLLEEGKVDEAILLLVPPKDSDSGEEHSDQSNRWWVNEKVKLKLSKIYWDKGMLENFVDTMFPLIRKSLYVGNLQHTGKTKKRLSKKDLVERVKVLDDQDTDNVFRGFRPIALPSDLVKASRAKKKLQEKAILKEKRKAEALAAGMDWISDESDDEPGYVSLKGRKRPLCNFLKDEEHHQLIIDLCKALATLQRYWEALEIINLTLRLAHNVLSAEKKEELRSLGAQMAYNTTDPKHGFDCVKNIVQQHPYSYAAWNCYYKVTSRLENRDSRHSKFLRYMQGKFVDCVPPILISGHQFTIFSHHQDAARKYLEAYKLLPENPLINLCVGTALINLALGFRLQNKHQCILQGLAFLYNNLRISENSQESLYNIARAYHHVGMVTLAALYYERVLAIREKDYPIPKLPDGNPNATENHLPGYCDLRREAAYNLHLIYKKSGALDLARQVLKDHCSF
ncbi:general transcription factor 3C polypeptide 3 [Neltuma alba]|uniref:general transcription factor 3C polypeptide 3 n=1 Tax=Neltuma alba TaxID=207710 RepID=UPI0010A56E78|nr:general transcription factor 3C polypeptide 3 [Prosopis alba]